MPGRDHVTGPQDVGAPGGPWACLWTVVGPPLADPMFFEWTVDVWPFVVARAGQSDEEWNTLVAQVEQEKGCTPDTLGADRMPACVSRSDDSMDVVMRLGADRLLWLRLDTLDYPVASSTTPANSWHCSSPLEWPPNTERSSAVLRTAPFRIAAKPTTCRSGAARAARIVTFGDGVLARLQMLTELVAGGSFSRGELHWILASLAIDRAPVCALLHEPW